MLTFFRTRLRHLQNCLHELVISGSWPGELRSCGVSLKWLIRGGSVARRSLCRRLLRLRRLIWRSLLRSIGRRRWRFCFRRRGIRSGVASGWWLRRCERHVDLVDLEPDLAADPVEEALLLEREVDERLLALAHELARVEADAAEEVVPQAGGGAT